MTDGVAMYELGLVGKNGLLVFICISNSEIYNI